ncbi:MAG: glycosyltransferase family 4 protein [Chloroflexi bacterium]|nr:glycosyltransferase family 4 protein [Chloroflexota bacterium]
MNEPLRVCVISGSFPPKVCGIGDYTANLSAALRRRGVFVLNVVPPQYARPWPPGEAGAESVLGAVEGWSPYHLVRLARTVARQQPDVVHLQYQVSLVEESVAIGLLPLLVRRLLPLTRFHVTLHDLHAPHQRRLGKIALRPLVAFSDYAHHSISSNLPRVVRLGRPLARVVVRKTVIGPGISVGESPENNRDAVRHRFGIGPDEFVLTCFGTLSPTRDYETLFAAASLLRQEIGVMRVVLVGAGHADDRFAYGTPGLAAMAARHGLELGRHILCTGKVTPQEVVDILRAGDVTVMPLRDPEHIESRSSFSLLPFCATPIVVTASHRPIPPLQNGRNVLTYRHGDPADLARQTALLHRNPRLRGTLVGNLDSLRRHYSWEQIAGDTELCYRASLGLGKPIVKPR